MKNFKNEDHFEVLRKIDKDPKASQRKMAEELNFSLGKLNYCLKALKKRVLLKSKIFKKTLIKLIIYNTLLLPKVSPKEQNLQ